MMFGNNVMKFMGVDLDENEDETVRDLVAKGKLDPQAGVLAGGLLGGLDEPVGVPVDPGKDFGSYMANQGGFKGFFGAIADPRVARAFLSDDYGDYKQKKASYEANKGLYKTGALAQIASPFEDMLADESDENDMAGIRALARLYPEVYGPVLRDSLQNQYNPEPETFTEGEYQRNPDTNQWEWRMQGNKGTIKTVPMPEGFVPESRMMSPDKVEDSIGNFDQAAFNSTQRLDNIRNLESNMDDIGEEAWTAGLRGEISEKWKQVTGTEDPVSMARKQYEGIRTSKAIQNLPPGVASDKDIELVLKPFPTSFTNYEQLREYISGLRRGEEKIREYNQFGARYLSRPGGGSRRGMAEAWDAHWKKLTSKGGKFYSEGGGYSADDSGAGVVPDSKRAAFEAWKAERGL